MSDLPDLIAAHDEAIENAQGLHHQIRGAKNGGTATTESADAALADLQAVIDNLKDAKRELEAGSTE